MIKVMVIHENDSANSITGFTHAVFYSGCSYNCLGCFNVAQQDYSNGVEMSVEDVLAMVKASRHKNVSLVGEPTFIHNVEPLRKLIRGLHALGKVQYVWTG
ncbi:MAG: 4Fe-4S cluster-binding domain-containing protein, partial [Fusobacteriaceae bacterium]